MTRPFTVFFWLSALGVAVMSWRVFFAPIADAMPAMLPYFPDVSLAAWAHIIGGPLALGLAPFQLWQGLRRRRPALHRWMGRVYGLSILMAGLASLVMLPHFEGSRFAQLGFGVLAVLWIATTALGIARARAGDLTAHRRWMLRSIALTFAAVTLRIIMAPLMASGWSITETYEITAWGSWVLNLIVLELWQRRRQLQLA
ncbi:DUF2306 domain-containing protein [Pararhodobacter sp. CCB-MM2]|uniref:DUF2306 domain-containing protein n=1 Tax=Pararhodobacter sp. CCB-MM2 TaxID=1786003 RepID=UPI0013143094|nr:DUF2306 domain-containing protein [Pararhodobacter sp. CCB-MM2]